MRRIFAKLDVDNRAAMVFRCAPLIKSAAAAASFAAVPGAHKRTVAATTASGVAGRKRDARLERVLRLAPVTIRKHISVAESD